MSSTNLDQISAAQKANADAYVALIRSTFDGVEKIAELNLSAAREFLNTSVETTQSLMGAKDFKEAAELQTSLTQPNLSKLTDYYRKLYELITETQKDVTGIMEEHYNSLSQRATSAIETSSSKAPLGGDVMAAAMKTLMGASTQAFENFTKLSKQITELTEGAVTAGSPSATVKAARSTVKKG